MGDKLNPLGDPDKKALQELCVALWDWQICDGCRDSRPCQVPTCRWPRSHRLARLFNYYRELTTKYVPRDPFRNPSVLSCHNDIASMIKTLRLQHDLRRDAIIKTTTSHQTDDGENGEGPTAPGGSKTTANHQADDGGNGEGVFDLVVKVALMVNCSEGGTCGELLEFGTQPVRWGANMSRQDFMQAAFPQTTYPPLDGNDSSIGSLNVFNSIRGYRLRKIAGLNFRPTNDLGSHLRLDHRDGTVYIFHHVAVLKEHLSASAARSMPASEETPARETRGQELIPRQLALEVIDSIQKVLFPADMHSEGLLRSLVKRQGFDPDCLRYEASEYRLPGETEVAYVYFGSRLADLYEEVTNPTPRGPFAKWIELRCRARHVMMATLGGLAIAIVLGFLGLTVQIVQLWLTWIQVKSAQEV